MRFLCVRMCTLHLRATTSEGCGGTRTGSLSCQVNQKGVSLLLAGPAGAVSSFPQLKVAVCMFYIRACRSRSGSLAAHQWAVKHRWLVPDAASAPFLRRKVCRSHFFRLHGTPQKWKTHQKSVWICYPSLNIRQAAAATKMCGKTSPQAEKICVTLPMDLTADSQWILQQEPESRVKFLSIVTACPILEAGFPAPGQSHSHFNRDFTLDR